MDNTLFDIGTLVGQSQRLDNVREEFVNKFTQKYNSDFLKTSINVGEKGEIQIEFANYNILAKHRYVLVRETNTFIIEYCFETIINEELFKLCCIYLDHQSCFRSDYMKENSEKNCISRITNQDLFEDLCNFVLDSLLRSKLVEPTTL